MARRRSAWAVAFGLIAVAGLWARLRTWPAVFSATGVFLAPTDSYYYARLAKLSLSAFPSPVLWDSYVGFPGMDLQWQPGHAWLLGLVLKVSGAEPFTPRGLATLAFCGPALGLLFTALIATLVWRLAGRRAAFVAAAVLLLTPEAVAASELGEADHHPHEILLCALVPLALLLALRHGRWFRYACLGGLGAAMGHFASSSGFLLLPPVALGVFVAHFTSPRRRWRRTRATFWTLAIALSAVAAEAAYLGRLGTLDYVRLSGFHVALLAIQLIGVGLPFLRVRKRGACERAAMGLVASGLLVLLGQAPLGTALRAALAHLGRGSHILAQAEESQPLFIGGLTTAIDSMGGSILALPIVLVLIAVAARRGSQAALVLVVPLVVGTALALLQSRFCRQLTGTLAVAAALALFEAFRRARWERALAGVALLGAAFPTDRILAPIPEPHEVLALTGASLRFLREQTPPTAGLWDPGARPEYAVLAPWIVGHLVATIGERPTLASPFGQLESAERAVEDSAAAYAETDPERLFARLRALGVRYVLAFPYPGGSDALAHVLGTKAAFSHLQALREAPVALGHLRQVFVAPESYEGKPLGRIYEVVEGARLLVQGPADASFSVELALEGAAPLLATGRTDSGGRAEVRVPFALDDLEGPISVEISNRTLRFSPSLNAVRLGTLVPPDP